MALLHHLTFPCADPELQDWQHTLWRANASLQLVHSAAPGHHPLSLLFSRFDVLPADLAYSVYMLRVTQIYIYVYYHSREINKCSSQSAFYRTFALLLSSPSLLCLLLTSRAVWQVGQGQSGWASCQLMTEQQDRWQKIQGVLVRWLIALLHYCK